MTSYELIFLLNEEEESKKIKEAITSSSGKVAEEKTWGKKPLAYPIKKQDSAYFYEWRVDLKAEKLDELKKKLNFNEKVLRYLLLKEE